MPTLLNVIKRLETADEIARTVGKRTVYTLREIEDMLNYVKSREKEIFQQTEMVSKANEKVKYLENHNNFLMMKLVNKGILSDREVTELHTRSTKKSD